MRPRLVNDLNAPYQSADMMRNKLIMELTKCPRIRKFIQDHWTISLGQKTKEAQNNFQFLGWNIDCS